MMKICVVGTGYVGLSNAMMLADQHQVIALDIDQRRVALLKNGISPIQDEYIEKYLKHVAHFEVTIDRAIAYKDKY